MGCSASEAFVFGQGNNFTLKHRKSMNSVTEKKRNMMEMYCHPSLYYLVNFNFGPDLNGSSSHRFQNVLYEIISKHSATLAPSDIESWSAFLYSKPSADALANQCGKCFFLIKFMYAWMLACRNGGAYIRKFQNLFTEAELVWFHISTDDLREEFLEPLHLMWSEIALIEQRR